MGFMGFVSGGRCEFFFSHGGGGFCCRGGCGGGLGFIWLGSGGSELCG